MTFKYRIQASRLSGKIWLGSLDKANQSFKEKEDATDMALAAVGDYVRMNYETGMVAEFPGMDMVIDIRVASLAEYETERAAEGDDPMMTVADVNAARAERADGWARAHNQFCHPGCITHPNPYETQES